MAKTKAKPEKQPEQQLSIRSYAKTIPVDEKAVRKARDGGLLGKGYDEVTGKIVPSIADKNWGDAQKIIKPKAGVSRVKAIEKMEKQEKITGAKDVDQILANIDDVDSIAELLKSIKITSKLAPKTALKYREIISLALEKRKLEESEKILVKRADVDDALFKLGDSLKKGFLDIPARCVADIMAAENEIQGINILTDEILIILTKISSFKLDAVG